MSSKERSIRKDTQEKKNVCRCFLIFVHSHYIGFPEHWIIFYQVCNTIAWPVSVKFVFDSTANNSSV